MLTRDFQTHSFNGNPLGTCYRQLLFFAETDRFTIPQSHPRPDNITSNLKHESLQVAQLLFASQYLHFILPESRHTIRVHVVPLLVLV